MKFRISKSKCGFRISIVHGNPSRRRISVIGSPFLDFAFLGEIQNPGFKIEIRISQSNAPLVHRNVVIHFDFYLGKLKITLAVARNFEITKAAACLIQIKRATAIVVLNLPTCRYEKCNRS